LADGCAGAGEMGGQAASVVPGLVRLMFVLQEAYARASARHDLTPAQAKMLCILLHRPRGMAELAGLLGVEKAALTGLVDRAERRGLAGRAAVPGDRRALRVTLTDAGRQAAAACHQEVCAEVASLVDGLAPGDLAGFSRGLSRILESQGMSASFPTPAEWAGEAPGG
jgi:DNA-binding MarR family transcriptional regulator